MSKKTQIRKKLLSLVFKIQLGLYMTQCPSTAKVRSCGEIQYLLNLLFVFTTLHKMIRKVLLLSRTKNLTKQQIYQSVLAFH